MEDLKKFIAHEIYIKTGLKAYISVHLPIILLDIGYYEISLSINDEIQYINIDIVDKYYNTHDLVKKSYNTYQDVEDIIDDIFKYIQPSKKF